jgi:FlaA1/EpsC-like NDP-sugar epimerase
MNAFRYRLLWLALDVLLINVAFVLGYFLRYEIQLFREIVFNAPLIDYAGLALLFNATILLFFWTDNVYSAPHTSWFDQMSRIVGALFKMPFVVWTAIFISGPTVYSRLMIVYAAVLCAALLGAVRYIKLWLEAMLRARGVGVSNLLIVGAGELGCARCSRGRIWAIAASDLSTTTHNAARPTSAASRRWAISTRCPI